MGDVLPLIINAALTGMVPRKSDNPNTPTHPEEIAENVLSVHAEGASIVHLHARDADEEPTYKSELYAEIIQRIRDANCDVVICVSCSGRKFGAFEQRSEVLELEGPLKPELASLTLGSLNFPKQASINEPSMIAALARKMEEREIMPELEAFDLGMIDYARFLMERGQLPPPVISICSWARSERSARPRRT